MKMQGNYYDHPTLGLMRVPDTVMLNRYEYAYDPDLGFLKKLKKAISKVHKTSVKVFKKSLDPLDVGKKTEKLVKKNLPSGLKTTLSKITPKELKGGTEKAAALAAAAYFGGPALLAAGKGAAGAAGGWMAAGKAALPAAGGWLATAGKTAGQVAQFAVDNVPQYIQQKAAIDAQKLQAEYNAIETAHAVAEMERQRQHERDMLERQIMAAQASSGGFMPQSFAPGGMTQGGASGMNTQTMMIVGAGVIAVALLAARK